MEIKGTVIQVCPMQEGVSSKGNAWRKQGYVIETEDRYPKKIYFEVFNDNIDKFNLQIGMFVNASVDVESREFNGKFYTSLMAYRLNNPANAAAQPAPAPQQSVVYATQPASQTAPLPEESNDLPF